jgi:signal transduction histidine kinase
MGMLVKGRLLPVMAHESSLTQAISNLLSNAKKFVAPGTIPKVEIWTERRDQQIRLWIKDNGIGINPKFQSRLFGMFERLNQDDHYEGTGIGLAIVRKAIEKMGGTVGVESDGIHGSSFWIELPAAD